MRAEKDGHHQRVRRFGKRERKGQICVRKKRERGRKGHDVKKNKAGIP